MYRCADLGSKVQCATPRALTAGDVTAYIALTGDRTPRYCGALGLIHPLLLFHTVLGQTVRSVSLNARANLGYAGVIWHRPVRVGTVVRTAIEVIGLKENSNRESGLVWVKTVGREDHAGAVVLSYARWVMVKKRSSAASTRWLDAPAVPELPGEVRAADLPIAEAAADPPLPEETGGRFWFEDYARGERIFHHDGQTVNPADHMSFTRLYQNSAKIHFDALLTDGKPLVFGGYPMSLGYAQAFNGFENRLGIVAMNAGSHANPVHAGDTLYSFTEVADADSLGDARAGALRCHLYVVKNENPARRPDFAVKDTAGKYNPSVVLDLDFWELVAKRLTQGG